MTSPVPTLDVLVAGECLVHLVGDRPAASSVGEAGYRLLPGGAAALVAEHLARLGLRVALSATIGRDDLGAYLRGHLAGTALDTQLLREVPAATGLVFFPGGTSVPIFYRQADRLLDASQFPDAVLENTRSFHTTCYGLSHEPARTQLMRAATKVVENGGRLSLAANYHPLIWPDLGEAQRVVTQYCGMGALVKFSEHDWGRLFGYPLVEPATAAEYLLRRGAKVACITLGDKGSFVSDGRSAHFLKARTVAVEATLRTGDAFWAGFLAAYLDGQSLLHCAMAGRAMAERQLAHPDPFPSDPILLDQLYLDFQ